MSVEADRRGADGRLSVRSGSVEARGAMEDEADPISIDDIVVLRAMSERLGEALLLAEGHDAEQLVELLQRAKAWVDGTLARNPSSERN